MYRFNNVRKKSTTKNQSLLETLAFAVCSSCLLLTQMQYASWVEKLLTVVGLLSAVVSAICVPLTVMLFGKMVDVFLQFQLQLEYRHPGTERLSGFSWIDMRLLNTSRSASDTHLFLVKETQELALNTAVLAGAQVLFGAIFVTALNFSAQRQVLKIRTAYIKALLKQELGWFDLQCPKDLSMMTVRHINELHEGLGEKLGMMVQSMVIAGGCLLVALLWGPRLALVAMSGLPLLVILRLISSQMMMWLKSREKLAYTPAESSAEDSLVNIRSVAAYQGERIECQRYERNLRASEIASGHMATFSGLIGGITWLVVYSGYALTFYYGVTLTGDASNMHYTPPVLIVVFFCVQIAIVKLFRLPTYINIMVRAKKAASEVFIIIAREPIISSDQAEGVFPLNTSGHIQFVDVHFCYPGYPSAKVLRKLSLSIGEGQTVVLAGSPGSGKSTLLKLVQRFYDPQIGSVYIDHDDIRAINVTCLRSMVGFVQQNSVLFGKTIAESIEGGNHSTAVVDVTEVAMVVGAHEAIMKLPKQYQTLLTPDLPDSLRQRLIVARELLRKAPVLLLDSVSYNLTPQEELELYQNIVKFRGQKTLVVVSSRVSAMQWANKVVHLLHGHVAEEGSFEELMQQRGTLFPLVNHASSLQDFHNTSIYAFERRESVRLDRMRDLSCFYRRPSEPDDYVSPDMVQISRQPMFASMVQRHLLAGLPERELRSFSWTTLLHMNASEWPFLLVGCVAAFIIGCSLPVYAILFGEVLGAMATRPERELNTWLHLYTQMFVVAGCVAGMAMLIQGYMMSVAGGKLTSRLRRRTFGAMLRQEMAWFDAEANEVPLLLSMLRVDASNAQAASGPRLAVITQAVCVMVFSAALSLYYSWKLGFVTLFFVPFMLVGLEVHSRMLLQHCFTEATELTKSRMIVEEIVSNIRILIGMNMQQTFLTQYGSEIHRVHKKLMHSQRFRGLVYGLTLAMPTVAYATAMLVGGCLLEKKQIEFKNVFKVAESLILGTLLSSQLLSYAPNTVRAHVSAIKILQVLNRKPVIYSPSTQFHSKWSTTGEVTFRNISFVHRTRLGLPRLRGFSLEVKGGQTVALVGPPGCGKSVPIQLMLRFYSPTDGTILLDGRDIAGVNLTTVRRQVGLVSGDPLFFKRSVADNIAYGNNRRDVMRNDVIAAAKEANVHNYITTLPEGYDTVIEDDKIPMTYAQKVRLSLARALLRDPPVLLVESLQATRDTDDELLVDRAIQRATIGRTCIMVGRSVHSVTQNANHIVLLHHGGVLESGSHEELLELHGQYYRLWLQDELVTS